MKERDMSMARASRSVRNRSPQEEVGRKRERQHRTMSCQVGRSTGSSVLNWGIPLLVAFGAILVVYYLGVGSRAAVTSSTTNQTTSAGNPSSTQSSRAPEFTLPLLSGKTFQLTGERGHPVVLYFMATTCATCVQGSQQLAQGMQAANGAGATALAIDVNSGDRPTDLHAFVQSVGQPAASTLQWGIDGNDAIATAYGIQTLETMVVINAQGQIVARTASPIPPDQLAQLLKTAM
jgi:peroxiredoxin